VYWNFEVGKPVISKHKELVYYRTTMVYHACREVSWETLDKVWQLQDIIIARVEQLIIIWRMCLI